MNHKREYKIIERQGEKNESGSETHIFFTLNSYFLWGERESEWVIHRKEGEDEDGGGGKERERKRERFSSVDQRLVWSQVESQWIQVSVMKHMMWCNAFNLWVAGMPSHLKDGKFEALKSASWPIAGYGSKSGDASFLNAENFWRNGSKIEMGPTRY